MANSGKRIAIFTSKDYTWSFHTWNVTIPHLIKTYNVIGIYLFPEQLSKLKGWRISLWYLKTFGLYNFILLTIFAIKRYFSLIKYPVHTWTQLADKYGLQLQYGNNPNSEEVIKWVKQNEIDILIIMVSHILKEKIINAPKIGIINKHASILPSCKGIFPFFWAKLMGLPTGVTFHKIDIGIDTGEILVQMKYPLQNIDISMLRFYIDVFYLYPHLLLIAVERLIHRKYINPIKELQSSYYSLPTRADYKLYRNKSYYIAKISDIFYTPSNRLKEVVYEICGNKS